MCTRAYTCTTWNVCDGNKNYVWRDQILCEQSVEEQQQRTTAAALLLVEYVHSSAQQQQAVLVHVQQQGIN